MKKEMAAAAAAAGCPVMAHQVEANTTSPPTAGTATDGEALDAAREADKAIVDGQERLRPEETASEVNPVHGEIPKANAE